MLPCPVLSIYSGGVGCLARYFAPPRAGSFASSRMACVATRASNQRRAAPLSARRAAPRTQKTAASPSTRCPRPQYDAIKSTRADAAPRGKQSAGGAARAGKEGV